MKVDDAIVNLLRLTGLAVFAFAALAAYGADHAARIEGPLHADGRGIRDHDGREVVLAGVNSSGMEWGAGKPWTDGHCDDLRTTHNLGCYAADSAPGDEEWREIESAGFNSIRLPIARANLEPQPPTLRGKTVEH